MPKSPITTQPLHQFSPYSRPESSSASEKWSSEASDKPLNLSSEASDTPYLKKSCYLRPCVYKDTPKKNKFEENFSRLLQEQKDIESIRKIKEITKKSFPNTHTKLMESCILDAIVQNRPLVLAALILHDGVLKEFFSLNRCPTEETPLISAVKYKKPLLVAILMIAEQKGYYKAKVDAEETSEFLQNPIKITALQYASWFGQYDIVRILLALKNKNTTKEKIAMHLAAINGQEQIEELIKEKLNNKDLAKDVNIEQFLLEKRNKNCIDLARKIFTVLEKEDLNQLQEQCINLQECIDAYDKEVSDYRKEEASENDFKIQCNDEIRKAIFTLNLDSAKNKMVQYLIMNMPLLQNKEQGLYSSSDSALPAGQWGNEFFCNQFTRLRSQEE